MIVTDVEQFQFQIDTLRPYMTSNADFERWERFCILVECCDIPILVNGAYSSVRECCRNKQGYLSQGGHFLFWFRSLEDKLKFADYVAQYTDIQLFDPFRPVYHARWRSHRFVVVYGDCLDKLAPNHQILMVPLDQELIRIHNKLDEEELERQRTGESPWPSRALK